MELFEAENLVRCVHIFSLVFCLYIAFSADLRAARTLLYPISKSDIEKLEKYHLALSIALIALWIFGIALAGIVTEMNPANVSPKLMTKFAVVGVLTLNATLIGRVAMPMMAKSVGWRLGDLPLHKRIAMCLMSATSFISWVGAFSLGAVSALKPAPPEVLVFIFGNAYLIGFLGAFVLAASAGLIASYMRSLAAQPLALIEDFTSMPIMESSQPAH